MKEVSKRSLWLRTAELLLCWKILVLRVNKSIDHLKTVKFSFYVHVEQSGKCDIYFDVYVMSLSLENFLSNNLIDGLTAVK